MLSSIVEWLPALCRCMSARLKVSHIRAHVKAFESRQATGGAGPLAKDKSAKKGTGRNRTGEVMRNLACCLSDFFWTGARTRVLRGIDLRNRATEGGGQISQVRLRKIKLVDH